ncbi:HEAT repeat domain-containing protein [Methanosarcina barkeri]|uniref:HEAT repeat domain-containing protein n=1 Tax=Methanosarcina barkeri TaxID=2208 RepID=UPI0006981320|nr:HEAT repeat domain-containing protein [Methanosarcina barkeri]
MVDQEKIHNQCLSDDPKERIHALEELKFYFSYMPDKQQAWNDLHRLTSDENSDVRHSAAFALGSVFSQVPDKQQAWNDLHRLTSDENSDVRYCVAWALRSAFSQVPDKQQAWNDLFRLTNDEDRYEVNNSAVFALGSVFSQVPDKQQAWNDLHRLTNNENSYVRSGAVSALGSAFSQVPDKKQAWNDLHRLTNDEDSYVRSDASSVLGFVFSQVVDKQQAWNDLHRLTNDEDSYVRSGATSALGSAFSQVPDKQQAWNNLHRLTNDKNSNVKSHASWALGSAFSHVPDKQQAWNDLHRLANDEDSLVRSFSNHSLGRVSIFMASLAETYEDYKKELEKAIEFFEIAAKEAFGFNPAQFCLPFYRSFHTIIFKKQEAREEVNKYLEEAEAAIEDSESKKQLFEAVENLAEALKEVQNLETLDIQAMKGELNFYRKYCDRAVELMKDTEETAPLATEVMRKGLPILDRNIKRILEEIQEKAKNTYKQSQGTVTEKIAYSVCREVQKWEMGSPEEMTQKVEDIAYVLKKKIGYVSENEYVLNKIEAMRYERNLIKQYEALLFVIEQIPTITVVPEDVVVENINKVGQELGTKVDGLSQEINEIRISLSPGITQEIEISSGIEILGTGAALITTIPLQEISYAELKEDLQRIKGENISKLSELPKRLANKIKGYLLMKDREDIVEQLT